MGGQWYSSSVAVGEAALPADLRRAVDSGEIGRQRSSIAGSPSLTVGLPLPAAKATYCEVFPLRELEQTMTTLRNTLVVGATVTTIGGAAIGLFVSRRVLRPLREVSNASAHIADGELETRLITGGDPDLDPLIASFNNMAQALQQRIERETRFASNVSHELRTPLTAMTNAMQVLRSRRDDLSPRTQTAVDIIDSQIAYFEQLVLDLLEISRLDAGASNVDLAPADVEALVRRVANQHGIAPRIDVSDDLPLEVDLDERRLAQVLTNLFDNAARYGGGVTHIDLSTFGPNLVMSIEDDGPGIAIEDRNRLFERFQRGTAVASDSTKKGTGLGLALVREHIQLLGGTVQITDAPGGGARFEIVLPMEHA